MKVLIIQLFPATSSYLLYVFQSALSTQTASINSCPLGTRDEFSHHIKMKIKLNL